MVFIKKAKFTKKNKHYKNHKLYKRSQTKKREPMYHRGGASSCESAYINESGFSIPDHGTIKGINIPSKRALLRGNMSCKSNHA